MKLKLRFRNKLRSNEFIHVASQIVEKVAGSYQQCYQHFRNNYKYSASLTTQGELGPTKRTMRRMRRMRRTRRMRRMRRMRRTRRMRRKSSLLLDMSLTSWNGKQQTKCLGLLLFYQTEVSPAWQPLQHCIHFVGQSTSSSG